MKKFLLLILIASSHQMLGQVIDYNKIILPMSAKDISLEERLVQLAWLNHPSVKRGKNQITIAESELKRAKASWLSSVGIAGNLNEFTIRGRENGTGPNGNFFPRYNFSLSFTLGKLVSTPAEVKIARGALENENEDLNILKLQIRSEVLKAYSDYKSSLALLNIQREYAGDLEAQYKLIETKFRNGESTINDYNSIRDRYDNQRMRLVTAENTFAKSRYELEALIGVSVDEVF